ncbi:MAG TPA: glycosyltransferase family 2 protein, partial [Desulfobacteraceae bacterium]|nr:glycosyltransferase family 2 protein [Desulfobacteraceae bacterium]
MKRITVIIVNWNGKRFLSECLNALRNQTCQDFSIILADNGSEDGSADFVSQNFPEVRLIRLSHNTGFAVANNIALKQV